MTHSQSQLAVRSRMAQLKMSTKESRDVVQSADVSKQGRPRENVFEETVFNSLQVTFTLQMT